MAEYWPDTPEIPRDPTDFGYELYSYDISAGPGGFHDAITDAGNRSRCDKHRQCGRSEPRSSDPQIPLHQCQHASTRVRLG